jgi:hypothetical protein
MRLISYDIGIKNLAYCVIEYTDDRLSILDWNVLSLLEKENPVELCSQTNPGKTKKMPACKCTKFAKFAKNQQFYCEKHAKKSDFILPTKKHTKPYLKKLKVPDLQQLLNATVFFEVENLEKQKKDDMIDKIFAFYEKQCLEPIVKLKAENAGDADLIKIGKRMKILLNENPITETITHVMIENQISPIATRMKTLQGMVTQFYIDHNDDVDITFVSSVHKLKQFQAKDKNVTNEDKKEKTTYKEHKQSGVTYCSQILDKNPGFSEWSSKMDTKKKDDLADCFLQGLWYFKHKNIISYADDLKINIVRLS